jgi:hypothetical protein
LLHPETTVIKWHFPQENATLHNDRKGTLLWNRLNFHPLPNKSVRVRSAGLALKRALAAADLRLQSASKL